MKVAIIQDGIGGGGRIAVLIEIISVLNEFDIIPDIITFNMSISKSELNQKYDKSIEFHLRKISPNIFRKLPEFNKIYLNFITRSIQKEYDFIIDSNNTACLLLKDIPILSYTYYPRIDRVYRYFSIHLPEYEKFSLKQKVVRFLDHHITKLFYSFDQIRSNNTIITLSNFSKNAIVQRYNINPDQITVIYPPVDIAPFNPNRKKDNCVATIGRFSPGKRQLDQIKIAAKIPDLQFNIMGFAKEDDPYYLKCKNYIKEYSIMNVQLHPSISYHEMINILETSKFFLHTLINEPFGITTVQGIAAGCIPIVPDSGGQIEVVPIPELRFSSPNQAVGIINDLRNIEINHFKIQLIKHIKQYSTEKFKTECRYVFKNLGITH